MGSSSAATSRMAPSTCKRARQQGSAVDKTPRRPAGVVASRPDYPDANPGKLDPNDVGRGYSRPTRASTAGISDQSQPLASKHHWSPALEASTSRIAPQHGSNRPYE